MATNTRNLSYHKLKRRERRHVLNRRSNKKYFNDFKIEDGDYGIMTNKEILVGATDHRDLIVMKFLEARRNEGLSTIAEKITVRGNHKKAIEYVRSEFKDAQLCPHGTDSSLVIFPDGIIDVYPQNNSIEIFFNGSIEFVQAMKEKIFKSFEEIKVYINWIYDSHMNRVTVPIDSTMLPCTEMYPWLNGESLEDFYDRYMESSASILVLLGPPGCGKTSLIRGLLHHTESSAIVTYDEKVLGSDSIFTELLEDRSNILVVEDADLFLTPRSDGNTMMHKFLNVGDGLVTVKGKKIIFSTNLPNISDIDDALVRPGRCFDLIKFTDLDIQETETLVKKLGIDFKIAKDKHRYTIAEIFSGVRNSARKMKNSFGFLKD